MADTSEWVTVKTTESGDGVETSSFWLARAPLAEYVPRSDLRPPAVVPARRIDATTFLVWDEVIGTREDLDAVIAEVFPPVSPGLAEDPDDRPSEDVRDWPVLSEEEFWPVIDLLEGKVTGRAVAAATRSLRDASDEFLYRWAETAAQKGKQLLDVLLAFDAENESPELMPLVSAVIGQGREVYERVLRQPDSWSDSWLYDDSGDELTLADTELIRRHGGLPTFTSLTQDQLTRLHTYYGREYSEAELYSQPAAAGAIIDDGEQLRLRIVVAERPPGNVRNHLRFRRLLESFGGAVVSELRFVESSERNVSEFLNVFHIHRELPNDAEAVPAPPPSRQETPVPESEPVELIVEVHVPLEKSPGIADDEYDFPYLETIEEYLFALDGEHGEMYDDGESFGNEYLYFVSGASEAELLGLARQIASLPGVPTGIYATVTDSDADMGEGRVVEL